MIFLKEHIDLINVVPVINSFVECQVGQYDCWGAWHASGTVNENFVSFLPNAMKVLGRGKGLHSILLCIIIRQRMKNHCFDTMFVIEADNFILINAPVFYFLFALKI